MLVFDLETDGLLDAVTKIHCIAIHDTEDGTTLSYNDEGTADPIIRGITRLEGADSLCGHNIIGYDLAVISKLYPFFKSPAVCIDTLLLSRLYHANILEIDQKRKWDRMPLKLYGRHSLESYGYRLGVYKGEFGKDTDWQEWSQDMQDYCEKDVEVTTRLWQHFQPYLTGLR